MKIAVVSDDGRTVAPAFGAAKQYVVVDLEGSRIVARETRPKVADARSSGGAAHPRDPNDHFAGHRVGPGPRSRTDEMAAEIGDCEVVLAGEFGTGARNALRGYGIEPVETDNRDVDEAIQAYVLATE